MRKLRNILYGPKDLVWVNQGSFVVEDINSKDIIPIGDVVTRKEVVFGLPKKPLKRDLKEFFWKR